MNDDEIKATANGIIIHLREKCEDPQDALYILIYVALLIYDETKPRISTIEQFAEVFSGGLINTWKHFTEPETMQ